MKYKSEISILYKLAIIIMIVLGLTSCSVPTMPQFMYSPPNEKEQVEQQEKLVIDTINTKDVSEIKGLFSKNALAKIDDIDGKLKEFLDFYSGNYVSSTYSCPIGDSLKNGNDKKSFYLIITIKTDKDSYVIGCTDVVSSPNNSDDIGICQLKIIHDVNVESSYAWHHNVSKDVPEIKCFYENDEKGQQIGKTTKK